MSSSGYAIASSTSRHDQELVGNFGKVRIWVKDVDKLTPSPGEIAWLSPGERARAVRLKDRTEGLRLLARRVFTRKVLSSVERVHPSRIEIVVDKCGRPRLVPSLRHESPRAPCEFSLSCSENVICMAVGQDCELGVDVEVVSPDLDALSVSKTAFDPDDIAIVERASSEERLPMFYQLWTKKEAFAKMQGHGICSSHVKPMRADSWQHHTLAFTVGEKRVVGSLAVCAPAVSRVSA